jgi:putative hydrolase of the HAD superfamily
MPLVCEYVQRELGADKETFLTLYRRCMEQQLSAHPGTAGCHSRAIRFQMVMEALGAPLHHAYLLNDLYWNRFLDFVEPFPGIRELLCSLRQRGIRTGVGSDMTTDWQLKKLHRLGLLELMDFVVTSEEAGVEKPERGLFQLCAQKAGCAAEECLFIGDSLKKDAQGALSAGMHGLWFQPDKAAAAERPDVRSIQGYPDSIDHIKLFIKEYVS